MSKPRKKQGNPDFRHRVTSRTPSSQEIESRLFELISSGTFANLKGVNRFWILNFGFWIDPDHKGTGQNDFKFGILDLFRPQGAGHEPK